MSEFPRGVVYVSGPQGCGKSSAALALMRMFKCRRVVDDWDGQSPVPDGALVITGHAWPGAVVAAPDTDLTVSCA